MAGTMETTENILYQNISVTKYLNSGFALKNILEKWNKSYTFFQIIQFNQLKEIESLKWKTIGRNNLTTLSKCGYLLIAGTC